MESKSYNYTTSLSKGDSYDLVFVTNMPSFYKVRLWNELNRHVRVYAIFVDSIEKDRNSDFVSVKPEFSYSVLSSSGVAGKSLELLRILRRVNYKKLVVGGWESIPSMLSYFISPKRKNAVFCESSIYEIHRSFLKDSIKKLILSRTSVALPSGQAQNDILNLFGYKGRVIYTGGCGLLNYVSQPPYEPRKNARNYLYVGRLADVKNLKILVEVFNDLPDLHLDIIGFGEQYNELKALAAPNVTLLGAVNNVDLPSHYQSHDVFVLPSKVEPWGLVVEEALNNGLPVIVSDSVGCKDDLVNSSNGLVFAHDDKIALRDAILKTQDIGFYNSLRMGVSQIDFSSRIESQVNAYLKLLE